MATIEEDYVSFETAKLLKEKGFNEQCRDFYRQENGNWLHRNTYEYKYFNLQMPRWEDCYACPTQAMAMKWLREVYELYIEVSLSCNREDKNAKIFDASIFNVQNQRYKKLSNIQGYEEACEAAIKYCLENLI